MGPTITDDDRAAYARDGVVCLRGAAPPAFVAGVLDWWRRAMEDAHVYGLEDTSGERRRRIAGAYAVKHLSRKVPEVRELLFGTAVPAMVGALTGARAVGFYWDQMFVKEPGTLGRTPWHNDAPGHPLRGEQIVGVWIALVPVSPDNGLECLGGSHRWDERYWPATAAGDHTPPPPGRRRCPDFEERRGDPDLRFLNWTMVPGDALFIHPRTLHFSCGNRTADRPRIAYATWWHGDDVTWDPRPECEPLPPGVTPDIAVTGLRPDAPACPIVWRA
ncbi:MAG: phytanoyl-CoA dioxygenase family protein [Rhodospirillaceae bacterium]|nr:phytanoyl-CoA dioxygenase family protein [Rhodospirillaceae bacterium]